LRERGEKKAGNGERRDGRGRSKREVNGRRSGKEGIGKKRRQGGRKRRERNERRERGERENEKWEVRITTAGRHIGPKWPKAAIFASLKSSAAVAASRHASNSE